MTKSALLEDLVEISHFYGSNPDFLLAGGGNTSAKTNENLYVKASGNKLSTITEQGFAKLNLKSLLNLYSINYPKDPKKRESMVLSNLLLAREPGEESKRPSVETLLHALLPKRFVVHTHPAIVNGLACSKNGESIVKQLFKDKALWVPYTDPGFTLACKVKSLIEKRSLSGLDIPDIIILQNHGLFVSGNSLEEIRKTTSYIVNLLKQKIRRKPDFSFSETDLKKAASIAPIIRMACKESNNSCIAIFNTNREILNRIKTMANFKAIEKPFTPDHIVYCQCYPLYIRCSGKHHESQDQIINAITKYKSINNVAPKIVAIEGLGVFCLGSGIEQALTTHSFFQDTLTIAAYAESFGGPSSMTTRQIDFIGKWEAETYRRKMSFKDCGIKALSEKIAIVTGGAQGFGKGLSEALLKEGAIVVIADRNLTLAKETATSLSDVYGKNKAVALPVDVSDAKSVEKLISDTVLQFGGLDLLVSNAGVLKAGGLDELSQNDFDLVTRINYTGFYLCTKYASEIMKLQNKVAPDYFMDIVQINSKSGLSGSKKNFAYAGGKFGSIGLTQSFALELVDYNIKVNAICPGNLFDGPLWSDHKNGLFVQYLRAGKVPGAKTIEDVKRSYEVKVPMKRGCTVDDVAKALLYIIDQKYETGQALPVTGGQNMLN